MLLREPEGVHITECDGWKRQRCVPKLNRSGGVTGHKCVVDAGEVKSTTNSGCDKD